MKTKQIKKMTTCHNSPRLSDNLINRRDENEPRNTIFVKGATSEIEAVKALKVITENSEDVAISTKMVRKGGRNRIH